MQCAVLGPLEVRGRDDEVVAVPGAKERLLLAVLAAASPGSVTVDRLLESLWDGAPPRTGRKSLQAHVVRLRTALEPDRPPGSPGQYVVRRHDGYALALERDQLDATAFADLVARGRALLSAGDPAAADVLLREALALWRGAPYADWPDARELDEERKRLEEIRTQCLEAFWEAELALGRHAEAVPELGRLVGEQPLHEPWCALHAMALYRAGRQADALDAIRATRGVLDEELGVEPGVRLRELEQAILVQDPALDLGEHPGPPATTAGAPTPLVSGCPYKGLARYEQDDAVVFRGRDRLVGTLVTSLVDHRLLVVSGSSGAGKSSVVRAGLLPALRAGEITGSAAWHPVVVVPGAHPVDGLAGLTAEDPPAAPVVLVCDQLEQLWAPHVSQGERTAFLDTVLGLLADEVVVRCVLTVRGDHVGRLAEQPGIAPHLHGALVLVPPLTEPELRQVVEEPARTAGLSVEPDLTDLAVRDVLGRTGALPLLSTALAETWQRRRDGALTLAGYLASGGVTGAVARSAEAAFGSLSEEGQQLARRLLVRLADQDDQGTLRARRVPAVELALVGTDPALAREVVETLVERRLLAREADHLEVAHEALLTAWPRLAGWLADDAVGRAVRRHLAPAALEWAARDRPDDDLLRGARLEAAADWAADPDSGPTELEREFIEAGVARAQAELLAARERADAEAAGHRRTQRFAAGLAVALVLALAATVVAVLFQRRADEEATAAREAGTVADANRLAALSSTARSLDLSMLLAAAAVQTADTPATRDGLLDTLVEHRRATGVYRISEEGIEESALSANGRTLTATVVGGSPKVLTWRPGSPAPPRVIDEGWLEDLAVSPDGRTVVAASSFLDGSRIIAYTPDGTVLRRLPQEKLGGSPRDVVFTPEGRLLALLATPRGGSPGVRGFVAQVDLETGAVRRLGSVGRTSTPDTAESHLGASFADDGSAVVVFPDGSRRAFRLDVPTGRVTPVALEHRPALSLEIEALPGGSAQTWSDGAVSLYDATGRHTQTLDVHRGPVRDVLVLPQGRQAVTLGDGGQVELWDIDPRTGLWTLGESLVGLTGSAVEAEVASGGGSLLTTSNEGQVVSWDLTDDAGFGSAYPGLEDRYVSNRLDVVDPGRLVVAPTRPLSDKQRHPGLGVTGAASVAAVFMDPRTGRVVDEVVVGDNGGGWLFGSSVAVSPDGRRVAVTSIHRTTVLDTRTREVLARVVVPHDAAAGSASWTPDGSRLLISGDHIDDFETHYGVIHVVDTSTWQVVRDVDLREGLVMLMEWSPDGSVLAVGVVNHPGSIALYDETLEELRWIDLGEGQDVFDLAFSPDGRHLAAARGGGVLSVVDTETWRPVHEPARVHASLVTDVEWLPDSTTVVTAGRDETVSLYDVERDLVRSRALPASDDPGDGYTYLLPSPTDEVVVLNEGDPGHRYPLDAARWLADACTVAGRNLTRAEWDRYLPDRPYRTVCPGNLDQQSGPLP
jgi:DNA-binding SARP family transcriptional activator/WD40 repeat protein